MLSLRGLSRRYGQTVALDGLSLEVPEGEVVGFVGPNGAGKTTAMRIALGVLEADDGEVLCAASRLPASSSAVSGTCPRSAGCIPRCASIASCATSPFYTAEKTPTPRRVAGYSVSA